MTYSTHRILPTGHIELREVKEDGTFHRSVIAPNQPLEKYNDIIEADSDYAKYRTPENADAYEQALIADQPTEEERLEQWRQTASLSRRKFKIGEAVYKVNGTPLVELIEALLAGLPEPQKTVASISYNESNSFDRLDAFVVQFGQALEMSEEEVDKFFQFCIDEAWQ
jgi:hypothetical protein